MTTFLLIKHESINNFLKENTNIIINDPMYRSFLPEEFLIKKSIERSGIIMQTYWDGPVVRMCVNCTFRIEPYDDINNKAVFVKHELFDNL